MTASGSDREEPEDRAAGIGEIGGIGEKGEEPEADVIEQSMTVADDHRIRLDAPEPGEASEADWLDQTIVEPDDEEER